MRWSEEVQLLQEEMRRTKDFFAWHADWWENIGPTSERRVDIVEGMRAYAHRQASIRRKMRDWCANAWRYVSAWVCLGQGAVDVVDPTAPLSRADSDSALPSLRTVAVSSMESLGILEADTEGIANLELAVEDYD